MRTYPEEAEPASDEEKGKIVAPFNDPDASEPNNKLSPKTRTTESREQSRLDYEQARCSVCMEDFVDKPSGYYLALTCSTAAALIRSFWVLLELAPCGGPSPNNEIYPTTTS
jgi:hypothetical protein